MAETEPVTKRDGPREADPMELPRGTAVDRYIVIDRIGEGGMGTVFAAYDHVLDRKVALKLVTPGPEMTAQQQSQLLAEAQAMAKLSHPSIVAIHDVGEHRGRVFLAMELVEGATLRTHIAEHELPAAAKLELLRQIGNGLAAAHAAGVIHRDFKPDNVLVDRTGHAKIADFGLAKHARLDAISDAASAGTPGYMAPEQIAGSATDARTDQYAFCVSAVEVLTGDRQGEAQLGDHVSTRVAAALRRGLAVEPEQRWPSLDEMLVAIAPRKRRWAIAAAGAIVVVATVAIAFAVRRGAPELDCARLAARASGVWTPAMAAVIAGRGVDPAVASKLDAWQRAWTKTATTSCRAARAGTEAAALQAIRQTCLDLEASSVASIAHDLVAGDAESQQLAATELTELLATSRCELDQELLGWVPTLPPSSRVDELEAVQRELLRANAISDAGDTARATQLFAELVPRAERLAFLPVVSESNLLSGTNAMRVGDGKTASLQLFRAITTGEASRAGRLVRDAWIRQIYVAGELLWHVDEALAYSQIARALIHREPDPNDPDAEITIDGSVGSLLVDHGRAAEALPMLERHVAFYETRNEPDNLLSGLQGLAGAYLALGRNAEARATAERGVTAATASFGADHLWTGIVSSQLVDICVRTGKPADAIAIATRVLTMTTLDRSLRAIVTRDRGYARLLVGDYPAAREDLTTALHAIAETADPEDGELERARYYMAELERITGHKAAAAALLATALDATKLVPSARAEVPSYVPRATLEAALAAVR